MIIFENVTKKFPLGNIALNAVSFTIDNNDFVFLVGPSGAGKTTILKLITQEIRQTSGSIIINDIDISGKNRADIHAVRQKIGIVFQDFKILHDKNVFENVALSLRVIGEARENIPSKVKEALALVNLSSKERVFPIQLSAGELQRVAIARAICGDRDIIIADEPTGNLDPKTTWDIVKIFKKLEGKKTIIIATHNTDIVNSLKKRVIVLENGTIIKDIRKGGYEL